MISITALSRTLHALIPLLALPAALHGEPSHSSINPVESLKNWIAEATNPDLAALPSSWANIPLNRPEAEEVASLLWDSSRSLLAKQRAAELEQREVTIGDHTLRLLERSFGSAPVGRRSLWISMHGGGGAPAAVNDQQWQNQIRLYEPEEGIVVAPRAPTDNWNLWHEPHMDPLLARLIEDYVVLRGVDPDRVYLMGYSAGGDGAYQLAPRMADRFAAAAMMAGHPNDASPLGLRNLPFAIFVGGKDSAFNRNTVAVEWSEKLDALAEADSNGYPHRLRVYPEAGHWMNQQDREALPWMAAHTRNPWPQSVVWHQSAVTHTRFYWLALPADLRPQPGSTVRAQVNGQEIRIESDLPQLSLRLSDQLLDLDQPVRIIWNHQPVFEGRVDRSTQAIADSLLQRADPTSIATAILHVTRPTAPPGEPS